MTRPNPRVSRPLMQKILPSHFQPKAPHELNSRFSLRNNKMSKINTSKTLKTLSVVLFVSSLTLPLQNGFVLKTINMAQEKDSMLNFFLQNATPILLMLALFCSWNANSATKKQKFNHIHENIENLSEFLLNCPYETEVEKINYCMVKKVKVQNSISALQEIMIRERIKKGKETTLSNKINQLTELFQYTEQQEKPFIIMPSFVNEEKLIKDRERLLQKKIEIRSLCDDIISALKSFID